MLMVLLLLQLLLPHLCRVGPLVQRWLAGELQLQPLL